MNRVKLWFPYMVLGAVASVVAVANVPSGAPGREGAESQACAVCGMEVDPGAAVSTVEAGATKYFCCVACRDQWEAMPRAAQFSGGASPARLIDVVCRMEVNPSWGISYDYQGETYHFCTKRCRERFIDAPEGYLLSKCHVCGRPLGEGQGFPATYLGSTYLLCSAEHRAEFKRDPAAFFMHTMWGIPTWLYYLSIASVLVVSFGVFELVGRAAPGRATRRPLTRRGDEPGQAEGERPIGHRAVAACADRAGAIALPMQSESSLAPSTATDASTAPRSDRFDILTIGWISAALRSRVFRFILQAVFAAAFLLVIAAGIFGNQNPALNIAPILTWTIWWGLLIILILFAGKAWCYVCPWDALAGWAEKLSLWRKTDGGLSLGIKWPRVVRNILIATVFFVGLTWIELGFGVTMKPRVTAYLAIAMLLMAVVSAMLFDRKSFCRYGCLVGRVSGLYALFAGVEVRARKSQTCSRCRTKECVRGSEIAYGCPTFLYPGGLKTNTYCIQCMECLQACPHDNLAVNLRPWGSDLAVEGKPRADEAYLALLMLAITGFHGLTMTPLWQQFIDAIRESTGMGRVLGFTAGMGVLMLAPIIVYAFLVALSQMLATAQAPKPLSYRDYFIRYAYALLPIALFYHIAHNMEHLLMEGPKIAAMISDPFGWGWNIFGTAGWTIPPMISLGKLWLIQVFLVLVGHVYSLWVAQKTSLRLFGSARAAFRSQLPMLAGMICFSVFSLWLLKQPMEMRTSAM